MQLLRKRRNKLEQKKSLTEALADVFIETWEAGLQKAKEIRKAYGQLPSDVKVEFEIPDLDLHQLEHGSSWYSFKKDPEGRCTFPAEEGKAAWVRLKNVANESPILTLVKAMGRNKLKKVSLGLFEYRVRGDFLQRRPLQKPEDPHAKMEKNLENVKEAGRKLGS